jgi:hypothetical protein
VWGQIPEAGVCGERIPRKTGDSDKIKLSGNDRQERLALRREFAVESNREARRAE